MAGHRKALEDVRTSTFSHDSQTLLIQCMDWFELIMAKSLVFAGSADDTYLKTASCLLVIMYDAMLIAPSKENDFEISSPLNHFIQYYIR